MAAEGVFGPCSLADYRSMVIPSEAEQGHPLPRILFAMRTQPALFRWVPILCNQESSMHDGLGRYQYAS